jgi:Domain of unknown function (DUF5919)
MTTRRLLRLALALLLLPSGAVLVLLAGADTSALAMLSRSIGVSVIAAGAVAAFREVIMSRLETDETANVVAQRVVEQLATGGDASAFKLLSPVRRGYSGYNQWALDTERRDMFFAGRSVLHRIQENFKTRRLGPVEAVLARKVQEGCAVRILLLDPRSDLVSRLAHEEGQTPKHLLGDLAASLGVCERTYGEVQRIAGSHLGSPAVLDIRVYDEVPYFAYHRMGDDVVVGFYFTTMLGSTSAAYMVSDEETRRAFGQHFESVFARAAAGTVLDVSGHRNVCDFKHQLYDELTRHLKGQLGQHEFERRHGGG